jgi:hypothetical protein
MFGGALSLAAAVITALLHGRPLWQAYAAADWWMFPVAASFVFGAVSIMFPRQTPTTPIDRS